LTVAVAKIVYAMFDQNVMDQKEGDEGPQRVHRPLPKRNGG
jgi:hypothetical protein